MSEEIFLSVGILIGMGVQVLLEYYFERLGLIRKRPKGGN